MEEQNKPSKIDEKQNIMKEFPSSTKSHSKKLNIIIVSFIVVIMGVALGWFLSGRGNVRTSITSPGTTNINDAKTEAGQVDESVNYNEAEGKLVSGGIEGEGTHHLERDGGPSKYVYLTSTSIDLESFVGKNVKVWGQTLSPLHAPWLMDVAKIKVIQ